ncbi:unnamed protein product [Boreogadus saida]
MSPTVTTPEPAGTISQSTCGSEAPKECHNPTSDTKSMGCECGQSGQANLATWERCAATIYQNIKVAQKRQKKAFEQGVATLTSRTGVQLKQKANVGLPRNMESNGDLLQKDLIILPAWSRQPGKADHYVLCVMKPADRELILLDSLEPEGFGDIRYQEMFRDLAQRIAPGQWRTKHGRDFELPKSVLSDILTEVVLQEGDKAYPTLALVCSTFRDIVSTDKFKRQAHFLWLNSVTTWCVEYPPTTEQSSTPCTVLGPAWHVVGSTKSAQVLNFDNRDFKQQRFMGGNGIGLP